MGVATVRAACAAIGMALAAAGTCATSVHSQAPATPRLVIKSMEGRDLYQFYCASCHGCDATGAGPVAAALRTPPADLTRIGVANGGIFPRERVAATVSGRGRAIPAHGSSEMPIWGPIFRSLDTRPHYDEVRIANIVRYVESIQLKPPPRDCR